MLHVLFTCTYLYIIIICMILLRVACGCYCETVPISWDIGIYMKLPFEPV